jgi:hypothetical protein
VPYYADSACCGSRVGVLVSVPFLVVVLPVAFTCWFSVLWLSFGLLVSMLVTDVLCLF